MQERIARCSSSNEPAQIVTAEGSIETAERAEGGAAARLESPRPQTQSLVTLAIENASLRAQLADRAETISRLEVHSASTPNSTLTL